MARVLVLTSTFPRWAKDTVPPFVLYLSSGLAERGHEVHVLAPHASGAATGETLDNVQVHRFRYAPERFESLCYQGGITGNLRNKPVRWLVVPFFLASQLLTAINLARKYQIEVIHAHWVIPQGLVATLASMVLRRPVIVTAHGTDVLATRGRLRTMLLKFAARRAETCTANSKLLLMELHKKTGVAAAHIPMGVDALRFHPSYRRQWQDSIGSAPYPHILFVGRLVEQKGVNYLIHALKEVRARFPKTKLTVVGEGPEESDLLKLAEELGLAPNVEFAGPVANEALPSYYAKSDVVVVPSVQSSDGSTEALGIVLLEAAACGVPVVATRVGGIPDFIQSGQNGILTEAGDSRALAQGIIELVRDRDLYERIAAHARRTVETNYSWESVIDRFDALIRTSFNNRTPSRKELSKRLNR